MATNTAHHPHEQQQQGYNEVSNSSPEEEEIRFYDAKIAEQQSELEHLIHQARGAVEAFIDRKNLFLWAAFKTTVAGRLLRQASASFDSADPFGYSSLLSTVRRAINGATYASTRLLQLEDAERTCGVQDYRRVLAEFSTFSYLEHVFAEDTHDPHAVDTHPDFLKYKNCEFEVELKNTLSCLSNSEVPESRRLSRGIDHLVDLIDCRLDLTKKVLKKRKESKSSGYGGQATTGYAVPSGYSEPQPTSYDQAQLAYVEPQVAPAYSFEQPHTGYQEPQAKSSYQFQKPKQSPPAGYQFPAPQYTFP